MFWIFDYLSFEDCKYEAKTGSLSNGREEVRDLSSLEKKLEDA